MSIYHVDRDPPATSQRRSPRREQLSGVVGVHSAENRPDYLPPDDGAEAVARWISDRLDPGSYHRIFDSDSTVAMMPWTDEAFGDGTGTNAHAVHMSFATRADQWPAKPKWWRDAALQRAALSAVDFALYVRAQRGAAFVPPARRITGDQARARVPGFVAHGDLDPGRRSDPGPEFPWAEFLTLYAYFLGLHGIDAAQPRSHIPATFISEPLILSPGDRGIEVAELQGVLRFWQAPGLAVDGTFGPATAAASEAFKGQLRSISPEPGRLGPTPLWGFHAERAYGRFLVVMSQFG